MYRFPLVKVCVVAAGLALVTAIGCSSSEETPNQPVPCSIELAKPEAGAEFVVPPLDVDDELVTIQWAAAGGGQSYQTMDPASITRIFTQDTMVHTGRMIREEAFDPQQVVFEREVKARRARIALPPGSAPQLVINPPALMPLRAKDMQSTQVGDAFAQHNIGTPAGHIR